jgi:hypothetical protein
MLARPLNSSLELTKEDFAMPQSSEVAYCGLYYGDCIIRNGKIGALSGKLIESIETSDFLKLTVGLPKIMPEFEPLKDYQILKRSLSTMKKLDCVKLCKEGGGSTACRIKECCTEKSLEGCWDCEDFADCKTLAWLNPVHSGSNVQNIVRIRKIGMELFLKGPKCW